MVVNYKTKHVPVGELPVGENLRATYAKAKSMRGSQLTRSGLLPILCQYEALLQEHCTSFSLAGAIIVAPGSPGVSKEVRMSRSRVCARCLSPGEAAESPPPSREAYALGSGGGWFRPHHLPQVESVELVSRFWSLARPAVFEGLPISAVLWLPDGVHSRPSRDPGGGGWSGPVVTPQGQDPLYQRDDKEP